MEKNGMVKRFLTVVLLIIAMIGLIMQGTSVFAETLSPEGQSETTEDRSESRSETSEEEYVEQTETEETEPSENQIGTVEEQSVSGNDISKETAADLNGAIVVLADGGADNTLTAEILNKCIVKGTNPSGVTVNLFDYSQGVIPDGSSEVAHDYTFWYEVSSDYWEKRTLNTHNLGISQGHLLRFGYHDLNCKDCDDYGDWNEYHTVRRPGIVQNKLYNGYPRLNLDILKGTDFGRYADDTNSADYLTEEKKTESLTYLFAPYSTTYKTSYGAVQGLFQQDEYGNYYYNSQENFASFNKNTNSFTLYNSPGVAKEMDNKVYSGQFFPFNKVTDVFDAFYTDGEDYRLTYINKYGTDDRGENPDESKENNYDPIEANGHGYIKCYAPNLNHYLGLTLEMRFVQPVGGRVASDTDESGFSDMIFSFSGDDDVWIFIDDVLVADLGGLHDALTLEINFATGDVNVDGSAPYTLYDSFVAAYEKDPIPDSVKFSEENGSTFADNTIHTLKMFYLERGHLASNLSLSFNIQPLPSPPSNDEDKEVKEEDHHETEEDTSDSGTDANTIVEISVSDNTLYDDAKIPKTGDDSLIGWWAALCILSLVGIGATICNLIIRKRKRDK